MITNISNLGGMFEKDSSVRHLNGCYAKYMYLIVAVGQIMCKYGNYPYSIVYSKCYAIKLPSDIFVYQMLKHMVRKRKSLNSEQCTK